MAVKGRDGSQKIARGALAGVLGSVALLICGTSMAVDLRGSLRIPDAYATQGPTRTNERPLYYWEEWNGFLDPRPPHVDAARKFAVVLTGGGIQAQPTVVKLEGGSLLPETIVARVGTVLRIENRDDFAHELFVEGLPAFSAEATSSGAARTVSLATAGSYVMRDRAVAHLEGHLNVIPDLAAVGTLESDGRYAFRGVPAGTYTLKVFAAGKVVASAPLTLAEGREITVDPLTLAPPSAQGH